MGGHDSETMASLTRAQKQVLGRIAGATALRGGMQQTKRGIAEREGLSETTVDRAIRRLRAHGLIEVEERRLDCGASQGNFYRTPEKSLSERPGSK